MHHSLFQHELVLEMALKLKPRCSSDGHLEERILAVQSCQAALGVC
jgi:hypothetical protein